MPKCPKCNKEVYFAERVTSLGKDWHRPCLKCEKCGKTLTSGSHAEVLETPSLAARRAAAPRGRWQALPTGTWGSPVDPQALNKPGHLQDLLVCALHWGYSAGGCSLPGTCSSCCSQPCCPLPWWGWGYSAREPPWTAPRSALQMPQPSSAALGLVSGNMRLRGESAELVPFLRSFGELWWGALSCPPHFLLLLPCPHPPSPPCRTGPAVHPPRHLICPRAMPRD
uniref:Cysteine-rich protein 1 n=1 Tax=Phocoena sinus TaxID=42100 RepID=A0A8C9CKY5_PHOSS